MHRDVTECLEPIRSCRPRHAAQHLTIALVELSQELDLFRVELRQYGGIPAVQPLYQRFRILSENV